MWRKGNLPPLEVGIATVEKKDESFSEILN